MGNASQSLSTTATSVVVRKNGSHIKRGVPIRLEVGPRDIKNDSLFVGRRDQPKSFGMPRVEFVERVSEILEEMPARTLRQGAQASGGQHPTNQFLR